MCNTHIVICLPIHTLRLIFIIKILMINISKINNFPIVLGMSVNHLENEIGYQFFICSLVIFYKTLEE